MEPSLHILLFLNVFDGLKLYQRTVYQIQNLGCQESLEKWITAKVLFHFLTSSLSIHRPVLLLKNSHSLHINPKIIQKDKDNEIHHFKFPDTHRIFETHGYLHILTTEKSLL